MVPPLRFFVPVLLRRPVVVLAGHRGASAFGAGVFLTCLLRRLDPHFLCVVLGYFRPPDRYIFRHMHSYRLSIGISCEGPLMSMLMSFCACTLRPKRK